MLFEEERQKHQHPSIVDDPPHINVAICEAFVVARVERHIFGYHQGKMGCRGTANRACVKLITWEKKYTFRVNVFHNRIQQQTPEMLSDINAENIRVRHLLMKVFQARGSSLCLQPYGQPITTVLCFIPPRPQDWIKWMMASRTFDATTT